MAALPMGWSLQELFWNDESMVMPALVTGITADSRTIQPGDVFLAYSGIRSHGLEYVSQAIQKQASVVVWEPNADWPVDKVLAIAQNYSVPFHVCEGLGGMVGKVADRFFGYPSENIDVIGITGTNGKTSCAHFVAHALNQRAPCGVIGTLGNGLYKKLSKSDMTTPDVINTHRFLAKMRSEHAQSVVMEVSSHALDQGRIDAVEFHLAVLTNISRDHLDYHGDMENYIAAKQKLFRREGLKAVVVNRDDPLAQSFIQTTTPGVSIFTYGMSPPKNANDRHIILQNILYEDTGLKFHICSPWGDADFHCGLFGKFNVMNLGAALGVLLMLEIDFFEAVSLLQTCETIPGRLEFFSRVGKPNTFVDYAHTPDALAQSLSALTRHFSGDCICVFGCGGDRDSGKRSLMGAAAEQYADRLIITDDNPRSEDGERIVQQILSGIKNRDNTLVLRDRKQAIQFAIDHACSNDVVLIAGKGHEDYQIIGEERIPFSDRSIVQACLS